MIDITSYLKDYAKMKKLLTITLLSLTLFMSGCANTKTIDNITYDTYGFFNEGSKKNPNIHYELSVGNIIWSVILCETIIAPVYFIGFSIYEPVSPESTHIKGAL
jgi:hypothetical protein